MGRIKFMLPNTLAVYLHDTPDHTIFSRVRRDLSSGCIRVEAPLALADFVLAEDEHWTTETLAMSVDSGETSTIQLEHPVPVLLLYMTAWADEEAVLQFRKDVYHRDDALDRALHRPRSGASNTTPRGALH
jgi:murein L,D-transpeptidase YcbB/YkuD